MVLQERFSFKTLDELSKKIEELGLDIPVETEIDVFCEPVKFGKHTCPNGLVVHPMEGHDSTGDGRPGELTYRRYERFAGGGAGLIWFEAVAVASDGRAHPNQLWINEDNTEDFEKLAATTIRTAQKTMGNSFQPVLILQLTHAGRYSKPKGKLAPIITHHSKVLDKVLGLPDDYPLIGDDELEKIQDHFVNAARLAAKAGFHGVDIKSCHGYIVSELLASFTRDNSRYGGSFENRARFLCEVVKKVKAEVPGIEVTSRLNVFDGIAYPYGFGVDKSDATKADLKEPIELLRLLEKAGMGAVSVAIGNPYFNPHLERPFDSSAVPGDIQPEHALQSMARNIHITRQIKEACPGLTIVGCGYSWARHFFPNLAAAAMKRGWVSMTGLGRGAFAYPDFARDIIEKGVMDKSKVCVACSACSHLMRYGGYVGCAVRDAEIYGPIYKKSRQDAVECDQK